MAFLLGLVALIELRATKDRHPLPGYSISVSRQLRYRRNFIAHVKTLKIEGVLKQALHETIPLLLGLDDYPQALARPMLMWDGQPVVRTIESNESILDVFDSSGQSLLILGVPGSGKTFTLLHLCEAQRVTHGDQQSRLRPLHHFRA